MMWRRARSLTSITRRHQTRRASMPRAFPWCRWLSSMAASRLWAAVTAWKSPVKWRLMSSLGTTTARPPPVAPPFMPKVGPSDGSRRARHTFSPILAMPWARPIEVVVFPSPASVGVRAETRISLPGGRPVSRAVSRTLALSSP